MNVWKDKQKRKRFIIVAGIVLSLAIIIMACAVYLGDYYHADMEAIRAFTTENKIEMQTLEDDTLVFEADEATTGFIFYPGGKVEYTAYVPLMKELASEGIFCVLVEMPFHLAVLDVNAAEGIQEQYPQIEDWYIGGHSLGGSMAASYLAEHTKEYEGLVLLGSYSMEDLSKEELEVLSIYGSEDTVLNREKYEENKANLPKDFSEVLIEGGCHDYFGMYGKQDGDGTADITNEEQIHLTVDEMAVLMKDE